jgi:hypothetical protein
MGEMKRVGKVKIEWSPKFAYAIGIIATDGNLSPDGRHINVTSKDKEIVMLVRESLMIDNKIGRKSRGGRSKDKIYYVLQFGDVAFYEFLLRIGLMPAKSRILSSVEVPEEYFPDFLRGCIDGDGNIDISRHPESNQPQLKLRLYSASGKFVSWLKRKIIKYSGAKGGWILHSEKKGVYTLAFGKADSVKILNFMYYDRDIPRLDRKLLLAKEFMPRWRNWYTRSA